nr:hypothetical protein [uncultured Bradyrhizobium sp.]
MLSIGGRVLTCKPCLAAAAAIALVVGGGIYGVTVEKARSEARIERMKREAGEAADRRDAGVKADLEKGFGEKLSSLTAANKSLQEKVKNYEKRKAAKAAAKPRDVCKLGDAAGLLRGPTQPRGSARAPQGGIANYLRRHPAAG